MTDNGAQTSLDRLLRLAGKLNLAEVEVGTSYGKPALKVRGHGFVSLKEDDIMVLHCPLEMKEVLMEAAPDIYYQTPHYHGWPALLVRLDAIDDEELGLRLEDAWRFRAPRTLAASRPTAREQ